MQIGVCVGLWRIMSALACNYYWILFKVFSHVKSGLSTFYFEYKFKTVFLPSLLEFYPAKFVNDYFSRLTPVVISRHEVSSPMLNCLQFVFA